MERAGFLRTNVFNLSGGFGGGFRKLRPHNWDSEGKHKAVSAKKAQEEHLNIGGGVRTLPRHPLCLWGEIDMRLRLLNSVVQIISREKAQSKFHI